MAPNYNGVAGTGNLSIVRGLAPTFSRIEDPLMDDLPETFIDRYRNWGTNVTDAPKQYHTLNAVVILSTLLCPYISLKTSFGEIRPNIWSMILSGTTITRKSTSMDMATEILRDSGIDFLMGTDGSPEGLLGELQDRDGLVSLFHRDEVTGWIESLKRDYMSGLLESFTRLYDCKPEVRVLRSGKLEIKKPRLVLLTGGIKTRMQEIITMDHIRSGFIPRFIMVSGQTNPDQVRPMGPPDKLSSLAIDPRDTLIAEIQNIKEFCIREGKETTISVAGMTKKVVSKAEPLTMTASDDAWTRMQQLQQDAIELGHAAPNRELYTPIMVRLSNSVIKVAMLLCAARQSEIIDYTDVAQAIRYSEEWLDSAVDFAHHVEITPDLDKWEKKADKIVAYIRSKHPTPVTRSQAMRLFHIRTKDMADIESTLVGRGQIKIASVNSIRNQKGRSGGQITSRVEYSVGSDSTSSEDTFQDRPESEPEGTEASTS